MTERGSAWGEDGWAVQPGGGELLDLGGPHRPEILVRGADVQGALGAFTFHHDVITENPPHAHHDFMKIAYVLGGVYHFRVGDAEFSGSAGTTVVVPRGSYHTFVTLAAEHGTGPGVTDALRTEYDRWLRVLHTGDEDATAWEQQYAELRLAVISRKHDTIVRMRDSGEIDDEVLLRLQDRLDTETVHLEQNRTSGPL